MNIVSRRLYFFLGKLNYISAFWWGIKLGKYARFDGKCYFERFPQTKIIIGDNCEFRSRKNSNLIGINRPCSLSTLPSKYQASIEIGNNCGFSGTVIGAFKSIMIGDNVKCGANTLITDSDWHLDDIRSNSPSEVVIEDNVWLGEGVKVLKGVTIGENSLIGAGSIVTKSISANVIAVGNPCKVVRKL
ncbi:acyltransferase [Lutimonas zeaxanthinifaciens]|uniref:acyltransferase n=1 Tax=Lutimonas zeaxanthinifaciens TaxID=3060215 RepID=UPI00265D0D3E|nr:acyltransferase [Lutimonas sp. YSD2104]WKK66464.1 acyltransferase [Lutimonas sp. YSD2104]